MENTNSISITKRDYKLSILAGFLIGLLMLPILKAAKSDLYEILRLTILPFFVIATPLGLRIAFYLGQKISIIWQIAKFGLIGVLNTLVDLGVLAFITFFFHEYFYIESKSAIILGITFYSLYKAFSFIIANVNSYYWNKYWTFEKNDSPKKQTEFLQFFFVSVIGFTINVFVASIIFKKFLVSVTGLTTDQLGLIGAAFGSIAGLAWNFIGYKLWVFKK